RSQTLEFRRRGAARRNGLSCHQNCRTSHIATRCESSMHLQSYDRRIMSLASVRKFVHRCEDGVDHVVSATCAAFGYCPSEALDSPLFAGRIYRFNYAVSVSEDQVPRTELNSVFLIGRIGKQSNRRTTGSKTNDRVVASNDHRGMVARIHIPQRAHCPVEDAIE